jgi:hypothetical protein
MLLVSLCLLAAACTANGILVRDNRTRHQPETFDCFYGDLSTRQPFAAAAQARAKGDLLLFNVNAYYVPLALRLAGNLARLGERNYLAVGYDAEVCRSLHQHGVCCGHSSLLRGQAGLDSWQLGPGGAFADRREKTVLFTLKLQSVVWAIEAGVERVLHLDLDVVVLQPPFVLYTALRPAFACAMDVPVIPDALVQACASGGALQQAAVPRQRLNTGAVFVDGSTGAVRLLNQTLSLILKRLDDAVEHPPPPCASCPFPLAPDWDLIWEQVRALLTHRRAPLLTCVCVRSMCSTSWSRSTRQRSGMYRASTRAPRLRYRIRGATRRGQLATQRRAGRRRAWWLSQRLQLAACAP